MHNQLELENQRTEEEDETADNETDLNSTGSTLFFETSGSEWMPNSDDDASTSVNDTVIAVDGAGDDARRYPDRERVPPERFGHEAMMSQNIPTTMNEALNSPDA